MYTVALIKNTGGVRLVYAPTKKGCIEELYLLNRCFPKTFVAATVIYRATKKNFKWDHSIPFEIMQRLGVEMRFLIDDHI